MDREKIINDIVEKTIQLTNSWEKKEFGSMTSWFKIFNAVMDFVKKLKE